MSEIFDLKVSISNNILSTPPSPNFFDDDLVKQFYKSLKAGSEQVFFTQAITGETKSGDDILEEIQKLATYLKKKCGIQSGDVVLYLSENRYEIFIVVASTLLLGGVVAAANHLSSTDELRQLIPIIGPKITFTNETIAVKLKEIQSEVPTLEKIIEFERDYTELLAIGAKELESFDWSIPVPLDDVGLLLCSSGTTGPSKCVELTYRAMLRSSASLAYHLKGGKDSVISGILPLYHGYGLCILFETIFRQSNFIVFPRFDLELFLTSVEKYKIEAINIVPPIMVLLAKHPLVDKYDVSSINHIRTGAAPCSSKIIKEVLARLSEGTRIVQGYGLTESSVIVSVGFLEPADVIGTDVGQLLWDQQCKVIDVESGQPLGPGEDGELCLKGNLVMKGYRKNPEATAATIDGDGWLHTGDLAYYHENGQLFIKDRLKELIKYNAMQVSPSEVEAVVLQIPNVKDAAVWGRPDEVAGELPMAFVVPNGTVDPKEIEKFVAERVSPHKKLRGGIQFVQEIPKSPSGKILRKNLKYIFDETKCLNCSPKK